VLRRHVLLVDGHQGVGLSLNHRDERRVVTNRVDVASQ
jgi:hypothetical protein